MEFFDNIWNFFADFFSLFTYRNQYYSTLAKLDEEKLAVQELGQKLIMANNAIFQYKKTDDGRTQTILERDGLIAQLNLQTQEMALQINDLNSAIESLKTELAISGDAQTITPDFIDETKPPYAATRQVLNANGSMESYQVKNPRDMFAIFASLVAIVVSNNWRKLGRHDKLITAWAWTIRAREYVIDFLDNWQLATDTLNRRKGDCEDSSILFVVVCRILGISPTDIFVAVGPSAWGYHAFPVVYYSKAQADEAKLPIEGWYIFESTLYSPQNIPLALKNTVNYGIDAGLQNWKYAGMIKPTYAKDFNVPTGAEMKIKVKQRPIDNSEKKRKLISEYWNSR